VGTIQRCEGCGAEFESHAGPTHRYMLSSPGCWARYGELLAVLSVDRALAAPLVMCVDAFAVQHPGTPNPQAIQSVAVHLINMYGYLVRDREVSPPRLSGHKGAFHWLTPPTIPATRSVIHMPLAGSPAELTAAAKAWVSAAWTAWAPHHAQVAAWAAQYVRS
jgi:hypothetical protein